MGCALTSKVRMTGRVASRGSLSAIPLMAFCTSTWAAFRSVDIVNWMIVKPYPTPEVERMVSIPLTTETASSMGFMMSLSICSAPAPG